MYTHLVARAAVLSGSRPRSTDARRPHPPRRDGRGQSTAEYALVLLGAATVALVFLAWAGRTDAITNLFDTVIETVIGRV